MVEFEACLLVHAQRKTGDTAARPRPEPEPGVQPTLSIGRAEGEGWVDGNRSASGSSRAACSGTVGLAFQTAGQWRCSASWKASAFSRMRHEATLSLDSYWSAATTSAAAFSRSSSRSFVNGRGMASRFTSGSAQAIETTKAPLRGFSAFRAIRVPGLAPKIRFVSFSADRLNSPQLLQACDGVRDRDLEASTTRRASIDTKLPLPDVFAALAGAATVAAASAALRLGAIFLLTAILTARYAREDMKFNCR